MVTLNGEPLSCVSETLTRAMLVEGLKSRNVVRKLWLENWPLATCGRMYRLSVAARETTGSVVNDWGEAFCRRVSAAMALWLETTRVPRKLVALGKKSGTYFATWALPPN